MISIHASRGGSDVNHKFAAQISAISIHASRGGSDSTTVGNVLGAFDFNPRFPWGKRLREVSEAMVKAQISIHASRGGSDDATRAATVLMGISIHASRGGSDLQTIGKSRYLSDFNPRFPWGKRLPRVGYGHPEWDFNPRFPCGKRRGRIISSGWGSCISIHASRGGSDVRLLELRAPNPYFNPRFPWGKRHRTMQAISGCFHFNPRFPWGKRRMLPATTVSDETFQSTLPVGEATVACFCRSSGRSISIHASRGGSDTRSFMP